MMMKRLRRIAIGMLPGIIGCAAIGGTIVFVASKQHRAAQEYEAAREKRCASSFPLDPEKQDTCKYERDGPNNYLPWGYVLVAWPEGITTWAIILTFVVIGWQTVQTKKSAEAALLNAQTLINAERPWIVVRLEEVSGPNTGFLIYAKNRGRTPAMIVSSRFGCVVVNSINNLPKLPPYGQEGMVQDHIAIPKDEPAIGFFDMSSLKKMAANESFPLAWEKPWIGSIFVFGVVRYRDLLDPSQKEIHETRWISQYAPSQTESGDHVITMQGIGVPREYDGYS